MDTIEQLRTRLNHLCTQATLAHQPEMLAEAKAALLLLHRLDPVAHVQKYQPDVDFNVAGKRVVRNRIGKVTSVQG